MRGWRLDRRNKEEEGELCIGVVCWVDLHLRHNYGWDIIDWREVYIRFEGRKYLTLKGEVGLSSLLTQKRINSNYVFYLTASFLNVFEETSACWPGNNPVNS
jgi:hypothetical protein